MDDLILEHMPTADRAAYLIWRKFRVMRLDLEELKAEAKLILVVEARKVDESKLKKVNVRSYLLMTIKRRLLDSLRLYFGRRFQKTEMLRRVKPLGYGQTRFAGDGRDERFVSDKASEERRQDFEGDEAVESLLSTLPTNYARVIRHLHSLGWCNGANVLAARHLGCSDSNVSWIRKQVQMIISGERGQGWAEAFLRGEE